MSTDIPKNNQEKIKTRTHVVRETGMIFILGIAGVLTGSLLTYSPNDPSLNFGGGGGINNFGGISGSYIADAVYQSVGYLGWLLPLLVITAGVRVGRGITPYFGTIHNTMWLPFAVGGAALLAMYYDPGLMPMPAGSGGIVGEKISALVQIAIGNKGTTLMMVVMMLSSFVAATGISIVKIFTNSFKIVTGMLSGSSTIIKEKTKGNSESGGKALNFEIVSLPKITAKVRKTRKGIDVEGKKDGGKKTIHKKSKTRGNKTKSGFVLPSIKILEHPATKNKGPNKVELAAMGNTLKEKLGEYKVEGEVVGINPGPVVTQFEVLPAAGTKVNNIVSLQDDLARAMAAVSIRVGGNIPGTNKIGIEVPNEKRDTVTFYDVVKHKEIDMGKFKLPLVLGVDISGRPIVSDLAKMPHLLVSGTTGSGKSVAINAMICSMLYAHGPETLKMIMVDPKMLELSVYNDIPQLLVPVVTDPRKAANALNWAVMEMERRYRLMSEAKVRNLDGYNEYVEGKAANEGEDEIEALPYIVIVIDELADLMMVAGKEVEQAICRIAQKARAAGIHLVLATQRPSVDVITGLIKANLPSRLSFQVSSKVDSRTILDQMGAEQLLGMGDGLFLNGGRDLLRVHGAFVSDQEVNDIAEHLKEQGQPDYKEEIFEAKDASAEVDGDFAIEEKDAKYDDALEMIRQKKKCSVSMIQRYLRIGYNRASRIVEMMEKEGEVGPPERGGARRILKKGTKNYE